MNTGMLVTTGALVSPATLAARRVHEKRAVYQEFQDEASRLDYVRAVVLYELLQRQSQIEAPPQPQTLLERLVARSNDSQPCDSQPCDTEPCPE